LDDLLKGTSRAFYLSLAVLPAGARSPLSLAYLIARAADTVADVPASAALDRPALLEQLRQAALGPACQWRAPALLCPGKQEEQALLGALPGLLEILRERPDLEREAIRRVVSTLIEGMIWDQALFAEQSGETDRISAGLDDSELERYTYLVAGCVGPFWSEICALSDARLAHLGDSRYQELAAEFGKALQWVNILRDVPEDHREGRFYLPQLQAPDFLSRFRGQARRAIQAFARASEYPLLFPATYLRHRMAVFWPLVLGLRTLEKLLARGGPRHGERIKVARWEVLLWVALSPVLVANDRLLALVLRHLRGRAERALDVLEECHAPTSR
jgi:farnesyl-diphosphate farnesyltransferase